MIVWTKQSAWTDKRRAKRVARELRAPGEHRVRSRVVRETAWRVEVGTEYPSKGKAR